MSACIEGGGLKAELGPKQCSITFERCECLRPVNLEGLARLNSHWVERAMARTPWPDGEAGHSVGEAQCEPS